MMFFVFWETGYQYDNSYGLQRCQTTAEVEAFINAHPDYRYTVVEGRERPVKVVTRVTKLELE